MRKIRYTVNYQASFDVDVIIPTKKEKTSGRVEGGLVIPVDIHDALQQLNAVLRKHRGNKKGSE